MKKNIVRVFAGLGFVAVLTLLPAFQNVPQFNAGGVSSGASLPATCRVGQLYFRTAVSIGLNQCIATNTWSAVGAGGSTNTMFNAWGGLINSTASGVGTLSLANKIQVSGFYLPNQTQISNIVVSVVTADAGNNYDWGIYDSGGTLKAHVGARTIAATNVSDVAVVGAPITLPAGKYYFAFTGAANTANLAKAGGGVQTVQGTFATAQEVATTSSGGALPASITPPADSWATGATVHGFELH